MAPKIVLHAFQDVLTVAPGAPPENSQLAGRWVDAVDLQAGDTVFLQESGPTPLKAVRTEAANYPVYNFAVDSLKCYAVGQCSVLVHNTNGLEISVPATLTANGVAPVARKMNQTAQQAIDNFDAIPKTIKGTISPNEGAARQLAENVADLKGISRELSDVEQHHGGLQHLHLEEMRDWHFWFNG